MKRLIILLMVLCAGAAYAQVGIGQWRDYLSFSKVGHVEAATHKVYASLPMGVMCYDRDDETLMRMNKATGLSDVGIATMAYAEQSDYLIIAYTNSNVDIVHNDVVYNIADIKRSDIPGDKGVNSIRIDGETAYLACGFGLVVLDLKRKEIKESYYLGDHGGYDAVYDVAITEDSIYVGTSKGVMRADKANRFLNIVDNWKLDSSVVLNKHVQHMQASGGMMAVAAFDFDPAQQEVFVRPIGGAWMKVTQADVRSLRCSNGKMVLSTETGVDVYEITTAACSLMQHVAAFEWGEMNANDAVVDKSGTLWVAHNWAGLLAHDMKKGTDEIFRLDGPVTDHVYHITAAGGTVWVAPGGKKSTYESTYQEGDVYMLRGGRWSRLDRAGNSAQFYDVLDVAVDPRDTSRQLAVAWGYGVLELKDNKLENLYTDENTGGALSPYREGGFKSLRVGSVAFDRRGDAWMTNSKQDYGLVKYSHDGQWEHFNTAAMVQGEEIDRVICDSVNGFKWMIGKANRIYVHDGVDKMAYVDPNNNSKLETHKVNCLVQDQEGQIWFGTDKGIKVIYDGYRAMANGGRGEKSACSCSNILFSEGGVDEYLMAYENISCMVVDGANRKWVGTANNGVYLISANGQEQLYHFTAANSKLFSDKILCLAIQPRTGEVLIGTDYGLQSYRGTATYATQYNDADIHAFPNPVKPEYDGPVAIKGFSRNALVHITDAAGHVVYSTTANGGQAIWNLRTNAGEKVASGVYFVLASDVNGQMRAATKILVVR